MNHLKTIIINSLAIVLFTLGWAMASDTKQHGGDHPSMDHPTHDHAAHGHKMGTMDHPHHPGDKIRNTTVDGYSLAYQIIDIREKMKTTDHPHEMNMTHHLMVYVKDPAGKRVESAKTGYLVVGPDKEKQKRMCMGMAGGYGADINFTKPGTYTVKTKVLTGNNKIFDTFTYEIK